MEILGYGLIIIGAVISLIFGIQLLVLAFRTSILWGLGYLFVPFVALIFIVVHWDEAKTPFLRSLLAIPFCIVGIILLPHTTG
jgi:uncharacterized membrane protein